MSYDLVLKTPSIVKKSWARDDVSYKPIMTAIPAAPKLVPTAEEKARISKLAALRMKAESGDRAAKKEWQRVSTKVAALRVRARGGDPKAVRACQIIEESGLFGKSQNISVSGAEKPESELVGRAELLGEFVGRDELLGEFVGDEERMMRDAGVSERSASCRVRGNLASEIVGRWGRRSSRRKRHLRRLVWQSAKGDSTASSKLQQITLRLQQRSNAGDARATALLQKIQSMQASAQAKVAAQQATTITPVVTPPPGAPPAAPPPAPVNVTYPAPGYPAPGTDYADDGDSDY